MKNFNIICFEPSRQPWKTIEWTLNFSVDAYARYTHFVIDRSIIFPFWTGCPSPKHAVNTTFCGPARDTLLTNWQTEKLNFDTCYITIIIIRRPIDAPNLYSGYNNVILFSSVRLEFTNLEMPYLNT